MTHVSLITFFTLFVLQEEAEAIRATTYEELYRAEDEVCVCCDVCLWRRDLSARCVRCCEMIIEQV